MNGRIWGMWVPIKIETAICIRGVQTKEEAIEGAKEYVKDILSDYVSDLNIYTEEQISEICEFGEPHV